jgi:hypothetical protein
MRRNFFCAIKKLTKLTEKHNRNGTEQCTKNLKSRDFDKSYMTTVAGSLAYRSLLYDHDVGTDVSCISSNPKLARLLDV